MVLLPWVIENLPKDEPIEQTFVRIEMTTTPLEVENNADLA
jgi:hypothetical protein